MPQQIQMDQVKLEDDGSHILDDPFLGADPDEENDEGTVDYGNEVDGDVVEEVVEEDPPAADDDDEPAADDKGDEVDETPADEETEEEETPAEEEEEPAEKDQRIPKARFDEINERRKTAEEALKALQDATAAPAEDVVEFDYDGKEQAYMEAVVDGEFKKANGIRKEIRAAEKAENAALMNEAAEGARTNAKKDLAFGEVVVELEAEYPMFVEGDESYDADLVDEVLGLHEGFVNKGLTAEKAMRKAVKYVAKMNDLVAVSDQTVDEGKGDEETLTEKPKSKVDSKKKVVAKVKQPQKLPKGGDQEEVGTDLAQMTEEEFDALPESKKKELRGDFL